MFSFKMLRKIVIKNKKLLDRYLRIILVLLIVYIFYNTFYAKYSEGFYNCENKDTKDNVCEDNPIICYKLPDGISDYETILDDLYEKFTINMNEISRIVLKAINNHLSKVVEAMN